MGSFPGHVLPGTFLVIMAFWWLLSIWNRYFRSISFPREKYKNTATFTAHCLPWKLKHIHFEAIFKIIFCVIGMIGEISTAFRNYEGGYKFYFGNAQHTTMFFFFGITSIFDLMVHHNVAIPSDTDYIMMFIAFAVEGLLFYFHLEGRHALDVQLHHLLLVAVCGNLVTCLVEMKFKKNVLVALARTFFLFLQGTWFYQIAFIMYNPYYHTYHWEKSDATLLTGKHLETFHDQRMLVTCMYAWHAGVIISCMMLIGCAFRCYYKCATPARPYDRVDAVQLIKTDKNGKRFISLPSDADESESDIEFEQTMADSVAVDMS